MRFVVARFRSRFESLPDNRFVKAGSETRLRVGGVVERKA